MRIALLIASVATLSISSALADPPATSSTPSAVTTQPASATTNDADKIVCRSKAAKIGSRLGATRECRKQREWDAIMAQDRREIERMQAGGNMAPQGH